MSDKSDKPSCMLLLIFLVLGVIAIPVNILSWAYVCSCGYYWWMPYVVASYPALKFSSFIALNAVVHFCTLGMSSNIFYDIQLKQDKSSNLIEKLWHLLSKTFVIPWVVLLVAWIMFKIITCFISPVAA